MASITDRIPASLQAGVVRAIYGLPGPVRGALAGKPVRIAGQRLDPDVQLLLRLSAMQGIGLTADTPELARAILERGAAMAGGHQGGPMDTRELRIPGPAGTIAARLYTPAGLAAGSPLVVFYHGGGWVIGSIASHDSTCRYLAGEGGVRVLSVDYRLAPEHPFPAAVDDSVAVFRHALAHADELGIDPAAIAVSGDSAGGNLAAAVCHVTAAEHTERPVFALLFYPATDATVRRPSREVYGTGFFLTDVDMDWFRDHYAPTEQDYTDPRMSVLLSEHLAEFPPTYLTVGGFDPLVDEVEAFGAALAAAGVPVVVRKHADLIHGFAGFLGVVPRAREAVADAVGALRTGLALTTRTEARRTAG
ncbi:MAG TPA: alpha/beta hydrolase [Pseudonocardiaceae bacterium]|nr:alpha/beta hydrolase [Pseudonocardiaceae bacterium]